MKMINVDYAQMNESLKNFILSVAVGSEVVIDSLLATADRHLKQLEELTTETTNAKLHFQCSVNIISKTYTALCYINFHSADLFSDVPKNILDSEIKSIDERFTSALARIKLEVFLNED